VCFRGASHSLNVDSNGNEGADTSVGIELFDVMEEERKSTLRDGSLRGQHLVALIVLLLLRARCLIHRSGRGTSRRESPSTEIGSIEPPPRRHFSTTWRRIRVVRKVW
jgi:hypothetical protein